MVLARPLGRGFPAAMVALSLIGLLSFRSAQLLPIDVPVPVVDQAPRLFAGVLAFAPPPPAPAPVVEVVRPAPGPVTGGFHESRPGHAHLGIDIDGETGDWVRAAAAGIVVVAGVPASGYSGYGTIIVVAHADHVTTLYAHLSRVTVAPGETVAPGDLVGEMGCTGSCTGAHLHFEVRENGTPTNPETFLPD
jgi:Meckel syndrome type 1 protein